VKLGEVPAPPWAEPAGPTKKTRSATASAMALRRVMIRDRLAARERLANQREDAGAGATTDEVGTRRSGRGRKHQPGEVRSGQIGRGHRLPLRRNGEGQKAEKPSDGGRDPHQRGS
jgi:hypothetical protein